jgi:putative PIN family toxin of toxin-antitoxin system
VRIVLDTDVMVSAFRSRTGSSRDWLRAALQGEVTLLLSIPLVLQYEEVLLRPEHLATSGATEDSVRAILDALCVVAEPVNISFRWRPSLTDPTDEMVLEAAVNGRADALLTFNERDFAGAKRFGIEISRPGPALRRWKEQQT